MGKIYFYANLISTLKFDGIYSMKEKFARTKMVTLKCVKFFQQLLHGERDKFQKFPEGKTKFSPVR